MPADGQDLDGDGDFSEPLPDDLDGAPRFAEVPWAEDGGIGFPPFVDLGAYEYAPCTVYLPLTDKH